MSGYKPAERSNGLNRKASCLSRSGAHSPPRLLLLKVVPRPDFCLFSSTLFMRRSKAPHTTSREQA